MEGVLKALKKVIFFLNNVLNRKVLEKTLTGSDSDAAKTILRVIRNFKMTFSLLKVREKSLAITLLLCHMQ